MLSYLQNLWNGGGGGGALHFTLNTWRCIVSLQPKTAILRQETLVLHWPVCLCHMTCCTDLCASVTWPAALTPGSVIRPLAISCNRLSGVQIYLYVQFSKVYDMLNKNYEEETGCAFALLLYSVLLTWKSWGGWGVWEMSVFLETMMQDAIKDSFSIL